MLPNLQSLILAATSRDSDMELPRSRRSSFFPSLEELEIPNLQSLILAATSRDSDMELPRSRRSSFFPALEGLEIGSKSLSFCTEFLGLLPSELFTTLREICDASALRSLRICTKTRPAATMQIRTAHSQLTFSDSEDEDEQRVSRETMQAIPKSMRQGGCWEPDVQSVPGLTLNEGEWDGNVNVCETKNENENEGAIQVGCSL
ncbi:hypothetical protein LshimejAT787_1800800 [Lyophyllum shimeji]|uniref:Uncharacterized protein n=1 Tax=Lyophyllum shimeji TaxID=47721 RepID=A0A9P3PZ93_LYOSH|nr:hypothetical protein LshimejAT787_1800800 [Lyophyllum shimeji]